MELTWIDRLVEDGEGGQYRLHYLVDEANEQCLATVAEPRWRSILYVTDIRIAGVDRSFMTLAAAQQYCESLAEMENIRAAQELDAKLPALPLPAQPTSRARVRRLLRVRGE